MMEKKKKNGKRIMKDLNKFVGLTVIICMAMVCAFSILVGFVLGIIVMIWKLGQGMGCF